MCAFARQMMRVLGVAMMMAAPAAADGFSFGLSVGQGRGGTAVGVGVSWGTRPVVAAPVAVAPVPQRVWVPTVQTVYRDVPVYDAWGRVISYRREAVQVQSGYWAEAPRPAVVTGWCGGPSPVWGYNSGHDRDGWDKGGKGGHDEWRDRDDHRNGGRENGRYPARR